MKPQGIIFDLDGTLYKLDIDWGKLKKRLSLFAKKYNFTSTFTPLDPEISRFTLFLSETYNKRGVNKIKLTLYKIITHEELKGAKTGGEVEGSTDIMEKLHSDQIKIAIVSSNSTDTISKVIKKMNWKIDETIGRENVLALKPNPEGVLKCLKKMRLAAKKCWAIGDRQVDVDAYKSAKIYKIFFLGKNITKLSQLYE
jgi:HAD superfamily hydrolase (TIGR01549 family)